MNKPEVTMGVLRKLIRRIREMNELESKLARSYIKIQKPLISIRSSSSKTHPILLKSTHS